MKNAKRYLNPPEIELIKGEEPQFRAVDGIGCDLTGESGIECSLIKPLHTLLWDLHLGKIRCFCSEMRHS